MRQGIAGAIGIGMMLIAAAFDVHAEEIILKNGDRITGAILSDSASVLIVQSEALGTLTVDRVFVQSPAYAQQDFQSAQQLDEGQKKDIVEWARKVSVGYQQSGGNTKGAQGNTGLHINRKTETDEWTAKTSLYYSESEEKMDAQKSYGSLRYAYSFGEGKQWYHFYKLEADHDRFANIDYRLLPSTGLGYWVSDADDYKLMGELAVGHEHTSYRDGSPSSNQAVITPHAFCQKLLFKNFRFEADFMMYVPVESYDQYRLRSENSVEHSLTNKVSWRLSLIDEYSAAVSGNTKKNDYRIIYALEYGF